MDLDIGAWTKKGIFNSLSSGKSPNNQNRGDHMFFLTLQIHIAEVCYEHVLYKSPCKICQTGSAYIVVNAYIALQGVITDF